MGNPYLKHCKYAQGSSNFFSDQYKLITGFWSNKGVSGGLTEFAEQVSDTDTARSISSAVSSSVAQAGSHVKTATDGWATYFWNTADKVISYVNPDSGQKIIVKPGQGPWQYLSTTPKLRWVSSTQQAMSAQKSQAPSFTSASTAIVPVGDDLDFGESKNPLEKAIDFAKEKPLVVGGAAAGVLALIIAPFAIRAVRGSTNEHGMVSIMDASGATIQVPPETPRWSYKVIFQDSEQYGPYVVEPIEMTAKQAARKGEMTAGDPNEARLQGQDSVERMRANLNYY